MNFIIKINNDVHRRYFEREKKELYEREKQ